MSSCLVNTAILKRWNYLNLKRNLTIEDFGATTQKKCGVLLISGKSNQRFAAWRRLPNGCSIFAQNFLAAFAKPLLCAGRFISTKFNLKTMRLNPRGNAYPEGYQIYKVEFIKDGSWFPKGKVIEVMESLNPYFKNHWRINDSQFVSKDFCKVIR